METFNLTYVRKCRASEALQALWVPTKGDYFGNSNYTVVQIPTDEGLPAHEGSIYWVPTLFQLTQLCRNMARMKAQNVNDLTLLSKMRITISSSCCNNYLNSQSMHDFWIMFYMNMEKGKDWNEGSNKWT